MTNNNNPMKSVELSNEQNTNMIDGLINNMPLIPHAPHEKQLDKVKEQTQSKRSREREER